MTKAQEYLNNTYSKEVRNSIIELDLSGWIEESWKEKPNWVKLTGELDLSEFPNLEKLDCSYNEITSLNLSNCSKLIELKCWDNQLTEIKFTNLPNLKAFYVWTNELTELNWTAFNSENLTNISISNNNFQEQDVSIFSQFINLEELCVGNDIGERLEEGKYNRFYGSLKSLKDLTKLKKLQIEVTRVREDFKHLSSNLQIVSWHKQNGLIAKTIPLERLYVIRGNFKQFIKKWGKKDSSANHNKYKLLTKQEKNNQNELVKLQSPEEIDRNWWTSRKSIYGTQFLGRSLAVGGIVLSFYNQSALGSGTLGIYPIIELITSNMEKSREDKKNRWNEFLVDADNFSDNYNELLGIVSQFKIDKSKKGKVNKTLRNLDKKVREFLRVCDTDGNKEIDIEELINKRYILFEDLGKNTSNLIVNSSLSLLNFNNNDLADKVNQKDEEITLHKIVDAIKNLEEAIIEYRKFSYYEEILEKEDNEEQGTTNDHQKHKSQQTVIDLEEHFAKIEQYPKRIFTY